MKIKGKTAKAERRVMDLLGELQYVFDVQNMDRSIKFADKDQDDLAASVTVEEDYQRIRVVLYPSFWEYGLNDQRKYLLHEFCHAWTIPVVQLARNLINGKAETAETIRLQSEKATSKIENVLHGLMTGKYRYVVRAYAKFLKK